MSQQIYGYERLKSKYGHKFCRSFDDTELLGLPEELISIWRDEGFTCHGEGYICFVNPKDYISVMHEFIGTKTNLIPFAKDSFGKLFAFKEGSYYIIDLYEKEAVFLSEMSFDDFLAYGLIDSTSEDYITHVKLVNKIGKPSCDQVFALYPLSLIDSKGKISKTRIVEFKKFCNDLLQLQNELSS